MPPSLRAVPALPVLLMLGAGFLAAEAPPSQEAAVEPAAAVSGLATATPAQDPDFLFRQPRFTATLRGGVMRPRAEGEIFDVTFQRYTAERSDFLAAGLGFEIGVWAGDRWEFVVGIDGAQATAATEEREWVEEDGSPIFQNTRFLQGPAFQVGVKAYPLPRGEALSRFAWAPAPVSIFVGGGVGATGYSFRQWGDFVDEVEEVIFREDFLSDGTAFLGYGSAGVDIAIRPRLALTLEGRYQWAEDDLKGDFRGFDPIDLSGLRLTAGLSIRF
jgi:opacity protein-like surface antigen